MSFEFWLFRVLDYSRLLEQSLLVLYMYVRTRTITVFYPFQVHIVLVHTEVRSYALLRTLAVAYLEYY
jgi:hypothetical protein